MMKFEEAVGILYPFPPKTIAELNALAELEAAINATFKEPLPEVRLKDGNTS